MHRTGFNLQVSVEKRQYRYTCTPNYRIFFTKL